MILGFKEGFAAIALGAFFFSDAFAQGYADHPCVQSYSGTLSNKYQRSEMLAVAEYIRKNHCSATDRRIEAGFSDSLKTFLNVPIASKVAGSFGSSSQKHLCESIEDSSDSFYGEYIYEEVQNNISQELLNQCFNMFQRNKVLVLVSQSPTGASVNIQFDFRDDAIPFSIDGVTTEGGFECTLNDPENFIAKNIKLSKKSKIRSKNDFNVLCVREGKELGEQRYFPPGYIHIGSTGAEAVGVNLGAETILGPALQSHSKSRIQALEADIAKARLVNVKLQEQIRTGNIEVKPFYFTSTARLRPVLRGAEIAFSFRDQPQEVWVPVVKDLVCPKATRVIPAHERNFRGGSNGASQWTMICSYQTTTFE